MAVRPAKSAQVSGGEAVEAVGGASPLTMGAATSARRASPLRNIATSCRGCVEPSVAGCEGVQISKLQAPVLPDHGFNLACLPRIVAPSARLVLIDVPEKLPKVSILNPPPPPPDLPQNNINPFSIQTGRTFGQAARVMPAFRPHPLINFPPGFGSRRRFETYVAPANGQSDQLYYLLKSNSGARRGGGGGARRGGGC